jgi:hypothetical protein
MAFLKKAFKFGRRALTSPVLSKGLSTARAVTDVLGMAGVPGASAISKGLSYAEKGVDILQKAKNASM